MQRDAFSFSTLMIATVILMLVGISACGPNGAELAVVDYVPLTAGDWEVSTPEDQGLDPKLVARLYLDAEEVVTIRSLLVIKNGKLIAERYFHDGSVDALDRVQSVTKSVTSALVGIAIEHGCLTNLDQKAIEFFPEQESRITDTRKRDITIRHLLQMRAGFPWEESSAELFQLMYSGFRPSVFADVPLVRDPGTGMEYSNISAYLLSVIIARACETDTYSFAKEHLFEPLGIERSDWIQGWEGYYGGHADLFLRPRDMARFGLLYMDEGMFNGAQVIPADWVAESLQTYSEDAWPYRIGRNYKDMGYGYLWWSAWAGGRRWNFAWGHGGQQIAVLDDMDMVIVVTADPLVGAHGDEPWKYEKQNLNLVADFIADLPDQP